MPVVVNRTFVCGQHRDLGALSFKEFSAHVREAHGFDPNKMQGTKKETTHADFTKGYLTQHQWILTNGFTFTEQETKGEIKG